MLTYKRGGTSVNDDANLCGSGRVLVLLEKEGIEFEWRTKAPISAPYTHFLFYITSNGFI